MRCVESNSELSLKLFKIDAGVYKYTRFKLQVQSVPPGRAKGRLRSMTSLLYDAFFNLRKFVYHSRIMN